MAEDVRASGRRPLIGVTGPADRLAAGRLAACCAVRRAGGRPVALLPSRGEPEVALAAVVVTGGSDIGPSLYGSNETPFVPPDTIRDEFELAVLGLARRKRLPVLGICRGAQLLNVFLGGTLYSDVSGLRSRAGNRPTILPRKRIDIAPRSRLAQTLERTEMRVNSLHHQAIKLLGHGLEVVARDRDGICQAIEAPAARFCVGVQWHPEYLQWRHADFGLFRALVEAAGP